MKEKIIEFSLMFWLTLSVFVFLINGLFLLILPQFLWDCFHLVEICFISFGSFFFSFDFTLKFYKKNLVETKE